MFGLVLKWLTGGGIAAIGEQLNKAYQAKLTAQNDQERIKADMDIAQLSARQAVLISEQGSWMTRWIRPAIAAPMVIYIWKLVLWDKILHWGTTDDLSPVLWKLFWIVIGAYFLTRPFEKSR